MTPAQTPPVAESVEQVAKRLAYAFSSDTMGDSMDVWWNGVSEQQRQRYIATITDVLARHRLASYEAGRAEGVREGLGMAAFAALAEKVDADATGDGEDRAYNAACDHITGSIRALSKEPTK